ncbi:MAG: UbiD family decarboxylase [Parvularculaceae bacterium]
MPDALSEYHSPGSCVGEGQLVDCRTIPLKVPAEAEIVLGGFM